MFSHYLIGIPALQTTHPLRALASRQEAEGGSPEKKGRLYVKKSAMCQHQVRSKTCDRRSGLEPWRRYRNQLTSGSACLQMFTLPENLFCSFSFSSSYAVAAQKCSRKLGDKTSPGLFVFPSADSTSTRQSPLSVSVLLVNTCH